MMIIPLTKGQHAFVDDRDYGYLMQWKWRALECRNGNYRAVSTSVRRHGMRKPKKVYMHRIIMGYTGDMHIDHKNHYALDNRRKNLRLCTRSQNGHNAARRLNNKSGHKGVSWSKYTNKWVAQIGINMTTINLGHFENIDDAVAARKMAEEKYVGEFAFGS